MHKQLNSARIAQIKSTGSKFYDLMGLPATDENIESYFQQYGNKPDLYIRLCDDLGLDPIKRKEPKPVERIKLSEADGLRLDQAYNNCLIVLKRIKVQKLKGRQIADMQAMEDVVSYMSLARVVFNIVPQKL